MSIHCSLKQHNDRDSQWKCYRYIALAAASTNTRRVWLVCSRVLTVRSFKKAADFSPDDKAYSIETSMAYILIHESSVPVIFTAGFVVSYVTKMDKAYGIPSGDCILKNMNL